VPEKTIQTILVVDDEKGVRDLVRLMLEQEGYEVLDAEDGRTALRIVSRLDIKIDLLITDILMPFMNGWELANRILSIRPGIKVMYISAYSAEILSHHNLCPEKADYIRKPFRKDVLTEKISRMLSFSAMWDTLLSK
jgi:two-component system cell cycle sensor histidine kinase/response regulator CckA